MIALPQELIAGALTTGKTVAEMDRLLGMLLSAHLAAGNADAVDHLTEIARALQTAHAAAAFVCEQLTRHNLPLLPYLDGIGGTIATNEKTKEN